MSGSYVRVNAVTVHNGELIAGGNFTSAGGTSANYVARWNGSTWQPLDTGTSGEVYALATYNNMMLCGGNFASAGGINHVNYIAQWNGSRWLPLGTGMNSSPGEWIEYNGELVVEAASSPPAVSMRTTSPVGMARFGSRWAAEWGERPLRACLLWLCMTMG